jgi:hypothetical protein
LTAASSTQAWELLLHSSDLNIIAEEADDDGGGDYYSCKMYVASWAHHKIRKLGLPAQLLSPCKSPPRKMMMLMTQFSTANFPVKQK